MIIRMLTLCRYCCSTKESVEKQYHILSSLQTLIKIHRLLNNSFQLSQNHFHSLSHSDKNTVFIVNGDVVKNRKGFQVEFFGQIVDQAKTILSLII